jgi:uncharacterized membrane protein
MHPKGERSIANRSVRDPWAIAVWALILAYTVFFTVLTVQKHNAFHTTAFDLGNVDQAVWNTRHGRILAMTNIEGLTNRLGTHVEPILLPISLLYFVWSDPRALLLLQTVVIALGAWPVYLLTQRALRHPQPAEQTTESGAQATSRVSRFALRALPLVFALAYLLFPALQSANVFDFHAVALAPTLFLFAFYFLETERRGPYALFCLLTMSCKEEMALLVAMLGIYALVVRRRWAVGLATIALAALWFVLAVGVIMPFFDPGGVAPLANRYAYLGDTPLQMALTVLTRPGVVLQRLFTVEHLNYLLSLLVPVAFLSFLAPQVLLMGVPTLLVNLLSTDGFMHQLEGFHYAAPLVPIIVVSAAYGAAWLIRRFPSFRLLPFILAAAVLVATLFYHYGHGYIPLAKFAGGWPTVTDHHRQGEGIARGIPVEASLATLPHPNPHASQRQQLTMIDRVEGGLPAPLQGADYIWLDVTNGWPLHPNDLRNAVENLLAGDYGFDQATDGWLLLRRGAPEKSLHAAFYDFARSAEPQPQYPMQLQFLLGGEPVLESLGFDLTIQYPTSNLQPPTSSLQFYWRALKPLPPGLRLYPFYFEDATGQILEDATLRPMIATVWYPPEEWQPGETIVTSTLPWAVGQDFGVGLGVMQGDDWGNVWQRLPLRVVSSATIVRLFEGDTWARLLGVEDGEPVDEPRLFDMPSPQEPLVADFGDQIRLLGYDLDCKARLGACHLALYWQAQGRPDASYTVFAQAVGPDGKVHAQVDALPQDGGYVTTWWLPGEVVVDSLTLELPPDAPRGVAYRLIVGLYDLDTGARLPVSGTGADFLEVAVVEP